MLAIRPKGTYFTEILFKIQKFSFKDMHTKMSSAKWRPFCLGLNVLSQRRHPPLAGFALRWERHIKVFFSQNKWTIAALNLFLATTHERYNFAKMSTHQSFISKQRSVQLIQNMQESCFGYRSLSWQDTRMEQLWMIYESFEVTRAKICQMFPRLLFLPSWHMETVCRAMAWWQPRATCYTSPEVGTWIWGTTNMRLQLHVPWHQTTCAQHTDSTVISSVTHIRGGQIIIGSPSVQLSLAGSSYSNNTACWTHRGLVTPYCVKENGQHWFR